MSKSKRLEKLRHFMEKENLAALLLTDPYNQCYVTGFEIITYSRPIFTIITKSESILIVPGLEEDHAKATAVYDRLLVYYEHPEKAEKGIDPLALISECLFPLIEKDGIGIEFRSTPHGLTNLLQRSSCELVDITPELVRLRSIKEEDELEQLRKACLLSSHSIQASLQKVEAGMTELELDDFGTNALYREALKNYPDEVVLTGGMYPSGVERTIMPHVFSNLRKIASNDLIIQTRITSVNGYKGECERTCFVGEPTPKQKELFELMVSAQESAFSTIKAGVQACEVDQSARKIFQDAGYGDYAIHRVGHSIGLAVHEAPYFKFDDDITLEEGMTFTVEPGIYVPGIGGFRHSDTILVTKNGYELLTDAPRSIDKLTL
ncbi:MAG: Xaa-Pro peptidase family protein [Bacillus sp. (in: firmicutes)]